MTRWFIHGLIIATLGLAPTAVAQAPAEDGEWVCPPCDAPCHDVAYDGPGTCPVCRMALIRKGSPTKVAILLYPGVELLDFAGPGEVFSVAGFEPYTVAATVEPVVSQGFVTVTPQYSIENCPAPDILVVPGGGVSRVTGNEATMRWIRETAAQADHVLSVCTGALVLAAAGLLDGLEATTHRSALEGLRRAAPGATIVEGRRWVDNGKILTAAGVSAGIDLSLHFVGRIRGPEAATQAASYMEYRWEPDAEAATGASRTD